MAKRYYSDGDYAGVSARRTLEGQDSQMISEDRGAIANLPQNVVIRAYPTSPNASMPENLNDTIVGVDGQMNLDDSKRRAHFAPKKI
jgi:hypothetical protein